MLEIGSSALPPGHSLRLLRPNAAADGALSKPFAVRRLNQAGTFVTLALRFGCYRTPHPNFVAGFLRQLRGATTLSVADSAASAALSSSSSARAAPASDLLRRLGSFLPQLAAANEKLQSKIAAEGAAAVNIETVGEEDPHILMVRRALSSTDVL